MNKLFIACIFFAAVIAKGYSLQCYVCAACSTATNEQTCTSSNTTGIVDKCTITSVTTLGITVVSRACIQTSPTLSTTANGCQPISTLGGVDTEICYCDTDLCNGSATVKVSILLAALIAGFLAKIFA